MPLSFVTLGCTAPNGRRSLAVVVMGFFFFLLYLILAYTRPYELYPELAGMRPMLVIGILGVLATLAAFPFNGFTFRAKQFPLVVAFAVWIACSHVLALHWIGGGIAAFNLFSITLTLFLFAIFSVSTESRFRVATAVITGVSLLLVLQGFLALNYGVFRDRLILEERQATGDAVLRVRGMGFMHDPNDFAQTLVLAIPFAALAWRRGNPLRNFLLVVLPIAVLLYGVNLTHSRGAIVSLMVVLFLAVRRRLGSFFSTIMTGGAAVGLILFMLGGRRFSMDQSALNRIEAWSTGLQLLKEHPLSGVGFGKFIDHHEITAHNSFVLCFAELGLVGYFLWLMILLVTLVELNAIQKLPVKTEGDETLRRYARSVQVALYAFLVSAWFLSRTYVTTLYLLIGLSVGIIEIARRAGKPVDVFALPMAVRRSIVVMAASICIVYLQIKLQIR